MKTPMTSQLLLPPDHLEKTTEGTENLLYTLEKLTLKELADRSNDPKRRKFMDKALLKRCTLELWFECIATGPAEKYTPIPITHDLYSCFCVDRKVEGYEYKEFLKKVDQFLALRRGNLGGRPPGTERQSTGLSFKGFRPSYLRIKEIDKQFDTILWTFERSPTTPTLLCYADYPQQLHTLDTVPLEKRKQFCVEVKVEEKEEEDSPQKKKKGRKEKKNLQ
jgi:hypothetical protein